MLAEMMRQRETGYFPAFAIAEVELGLGNVDAALEWLNRAAEERNLGFYLPWNDLFIVRFAAKDVSKL